MQGWCFFCTLLWAEALCSGSNSKQQYFAAAVLRTAARSQQQHFAAVILCGFLAPSFLQWEYFRSAVLRNGIEALCSRDTLRFLGTLLWAAALCSRGTSRQRYIAAALLWAALQLGSWSLFFVHLGGFAAWHWEPWRPCSGNGFLVDFGGLRLGSEGLVFGFIGRGSRDLPQ